MTTKIETSKELLQNLTYLVKNFQAQWKANENNLNDIPYDLWSCTGLPFFTKALKLINQLKENQPN
jgi:hypothetical protein